MMLNPANGCGCCSTPCLPTCLACKDSKGNALTFALVGTVTDSINGSKPLFYLGSLAHKGEWISGWLPFSGLGFAGGSYTDPCNLNQVSSYYRYQFQCNWDGATPPNNQPTTMFAQINFLVTYSGGGIGLSTGCFGILAASLNTTSFKTPPWQVLETDPGYDVYDGFGHSYSTSTSSCSPLTTRADFTVTGSDGPIGPAAVAKLLPVTTADFSIPRFVSPGFGYGCTIRGPVPKKKLTLTWTGPAAGSGILAPTTDASYSPPPDIWFMKRTSGLIAKMDNTMSLLTNLDGTAVPNGPFNYLSDTYLKEYTLDPLYISFGVQVNSTTWNAGYKTFVVTL